MEDYMRKFIAISVLILFVSASLDYSSSAQAEDTPSISAFHSCVNFFSRKLSVRENACRRFEFEVSVDGEDANGDGLECPCFNEFRLRTKFTLIPSFTITDLCFIEDPDSEIFTSGIALFVLSDDPFIYASALELSVGDRSFNLCEINLSNFSEGFSENFDRREFIDTDEFGVCGDLIRDWIQEESIPECE